MTLGDLIKKFRAEADISMDEFAERAGLSKGYISMLEKNINPKTGQPIAPSLQTIKQVSSVLNIEFDTVISMIDQDVALKGADDIFSHPDTIPIERKRFPLLGGIACREPTFAENDFESYVEAGADIRADFAMKCHGDSMKNIGINDGYLVFIRKQPKVDNGEVAAVNIDGEFTLKRFYDYGSILVLRAENPDYDDLEYKEYDADNIVVLGKAIAFQGNIK